jgi:hypothetical protein
MRPARLSRCTGTISLRSGTSSRASSPFAGKLYGPGTIAYMADPHFEHEMHTATGGTIFFVQYAGPITGAPPIYDGRMNLKEAPPLAQQDLEH